MKLLKPVIYILLLCFIFSGYSCSQEDKLPHQVLPVDKMSEILLDLQLAKAYNNSYFRREDTTYPEDREERIKIFYQQVLQSYDIDTATFFHSFRFYTEHPDWIKKVYKHMQDSLDQKITVHQKAEEKKRENKESHSQLDALFKSPWKEYMDTWHAFSDSIHQRKTRIIYPWEEATTTPMRKQETKNIQ